MSNYTKATNFASKDSLSSGNPAKIIKGTEINTEFDAISTAVATKADKTYVDDLISTAGTGSVSSVASGTGLTGGPITTTGTLSIANTGVTAGTYGQAGVSYPIITVNAQGQITSASVSTSFGSGGGSGVSSFNSRTGAVTLSSTDVTNALGYVPPSLSGNNTWSGLNTFSQYITSPSHNYSSTTSTYSDNSGSSIKTAVGNTYVWEISSSQCLSAVNLLPSGDNSKTLGSGGNRWSVVYSATGTINTSDRREKTDIQTSDKGLAFINSLNPVKYKWKNSGNLDANGNPIPGTRYHYGLIAQEVSAVIGNGTNFAGWVKTNPSNENSLEGLRYDQFIAPLIKAVQELSAEVEALKAKLSK